MTTKEVLKELESMGNPGTKKVLTNHGAKEPFFGVKVQDLKKIVKKVKKDHDLALELYDTGNTDAMYLAGLIADESKVTKAQLNKWIKKAYWYYLSEFTVPWLAADSPHGWDMGLKWIDDKNEMIQGAGWATLSNWISVTPDENLDIKALTQLLERAKNNVHNQTSRLSYTMNGFIIAVGSYVKDLSNKALAAGSAIGKVTVEMENTKCKVPLAKDYIQKIIDKDRVGKKRKMARC